MKNLKLSFLSVCFLVFNSSYSQGVSSSNLIDDLAQASSINPAYSIKGSLTVSLPSYSYSFSNSGFTYNDLIQKRGTSDSLYLNTTGISNLLKSTNNMIQNKVFEFVAVGFKFKKFDFGLGYREKSLSRLKYFKSNWDNLFFGLTNSWGKEIELGTEFKSRKYRELIFKISYPLHKVRLGGNFKLLNGIADISTSDHSIILTSDTTTFESQLKTNYTINSANSENFGTYLGNYPVKGVNLGYALDLGVIYELSNKVQFSISALDLGSIKWESNPINYSSDSSFTPVGLVYSFFSSDSLGLMSAIQKSLYMSESNNSYSTTLTPKFHFSTKLYIDSVNTFGMSVYSEYYEKMYHSITFSYSRRFKFFSSGINYSYSNNSHNIGINSTLKLKMAQLFFITDNVLSHSNTAAFYYYDKLTGVNQSILIPKRVKNRSYCVGKNLLF